MAIRGSCLCGGVTFEIDRACGPAEYCHCNRCRKVSGSASLLTIRVNTQDYRFLTGRELVKTYAAPILYSPPAYRSFFCSTCGSQVPPPSPEDESFEIPAGLFDDDFGIRPDKHIFVDFMPPWDDLHQELPVYTRRQLYHLRGEDRVAGILASASTRQDKARALAQVVQLAGGFHWVGLYDVSQTDISAIAWTGTSVPAFPTFPVTKGINGAAVAQKQPVVVQDVSKDARYLTTFGQTKAEAIFPVLSASGEVLGTIDVESDRVNAFGPEDEAFLNRCTQLLAPLWNSS